MDEIERSLAAFARAPNGGMIMTGSFLTRFTASQWSRWRPATNCRRFISRRYVVEEGGLLSYGPDYTDGYRKAADYVDRILRGAKPGELPVQAPSKYELVINARTAKALGLEVSPTLLAIADDVIE